MLRAFSTAATGMTGQQMVVDTIAHNLANINTNGFKRTQLGFQDLLYVKMREPGAEVASGVKSPTGVEIGSGVRVAATTKVQTAGELENTGRDLDFAITGEGFFQVTMPNGEKRYTRDGAFQRNANGAIVTSIGYYLEPAITLPAYTVSVSVGPEGSVTVKNGSGTTSVVGTIQLARFPNPTGLSSEGGNLLAETEASGAPTVGIPGRTGMGSIEAGFLEKSNVQMVSELVNLITAQRAYEINSRAIKAGDDMLNTANQLVR
jgi:flagellar basal-body rod protein FlgG